MPRFNMNLYDCLTCLIGMTADVVILNPNDEILVEHSGKVNVNDDVPKYLWNLTVTLITVSVGFPNKLVIYVDERSDLL